MNESTSTSEEHKICETPAVTNDHDTAEERMYFRFQAFNFWFGFDISHYHLQGCQKDVERKWQGLRYLNQR